ncbi:hypothetical protein [Pseudarthrobacter sulfonivorans]|nr:hypothetical protein [Pseudarthrobacter sulfonivorans]
MSHTTGLLAESWCERDNLMSLSGAWLFIVIGILFVAGDRVRVPRH